ncbi:hypothetical protein ES705_15210 [subsurface metagenome]
MGSHSKVAGLPDLTDEKIWVGNPSNRPVEEDKPVGDLGLSYYGKVTTYTDTTHFKASALAGFGDTFFKGYFVYVVRDAGGAGAAPQFEEKQILNYTSADGTFNHEAFSTPLAEDDEVLILLMPIGLNVLSAGETLLANAGATGTTTSTSYGKKKEIQVLRGGQIRVEMELGSGGVSYGSGYGKVYVNGGAVGSEHYQSGADGVIWATFEDVISVNKDDLVQLYTKAATSGKIFSCRNFKIFASLIPKMATILKD